MRKLSDQELEKTIKRALDDVVVAEFEAEYANKVPNGKYAKFDALRIIAPLGKYQQYHDDGYVEVMDHTKKLCEDYNDQRQIDHLYVLQMCDCEIPSAGSLDFYKYEGGWKSTLHIHVFYGPRKNQLQNIAQRAYVETQALGHLKKLKILEKKMRNSGFELHKKFRKLDIGAKASIGSFYALISRGYTKEQIKENLEEHQLKDLELIS